MEDFVFTSFDNTKIHCTLWADVNNPKGVIQILHGMTSYGKRYNDFAMYLNDNGFIAFADDHRGHGNSSAPDKLGQVGKDNFLNCVKDQIEITKMLKDRYQLPIQLFAHSYGSFLAQRYIQLAGSLINGIILSGSAYMGKKKLLLGKVITSIQSLFFGDDKPNKFLYNLTYKSNNKPFLSENINNAWLNRDLSKVKDYNNDPECNYIVSIGFYYSMMRGMYQSYIKKNLNNIPKNLPIKILSGALDPLGGMGEKVKKLFDMYNSINIEDVSMKLYPQVRHELTGDPDKELILSDIVEFYNSNINNE